MAKDRDCIMRTHHGRRKYDEKEAVDLMAALRRVIRRIFEFEGLLATFKATGLNLIMLILYHNNHAQMVT